MPVKIKMQCPEGPLYDAAKGVVGKLREAGYQTYWVGGAVRDIRRGEEPEDIDLVTVASPEAIQSLYPDADLVGACFGVSLVKAGGYTFEIATCREERGYSDGRRPDSVRYTKNFEMDIMRLILFLIHPIHTCGPYGMDIFTEIMIYCAYYV